jgi:hypothetical protein
MGAADRRIVCFYIHALPDTRVTGTFRLAQECRNWGQARPQLVELSKQGWCWWYRKYAQGHTVLEGLETDGREGRKGLWVDPQPVPPWKWRKRKER